uniref:Uncharacterized protein n=1 Tax=Plectus sambesii TaxID=2011161 RepID=A0A914ULD9_9BILA
MKSRNRGDDALARSGRSARPLTAAAAARSIRSPNLAVERGDRVSTLITALCRPCRSMLTCCVAVDSARHDSPVTFYQPRSGPRKSINLADTPVITLSPRRPSLSATTVPSAGTAAGTAAVTTVRPAKPSTSFADAQRQQRNVASKPRKDGAAGDAADAAEAESKKKLAAATCIERSVDV